MRAPITKRRVALAALAAIAVAVPVIGTAQGGRMRFVVPRADSFFTFDSPTFNGGSAFQGGYSRTGTLSANGRLVRFDGPLGCLPRGNPRFVYELTLNQPQTGALARGRWAGRCTRNGRWHATLRVVNKPLRRGEATGCGLATVHRGGNVVDAVQWCDRVRLVR